MDIAWASETTVSTIKIVRQISWDAWIQLKADEIISKMSGLEIAGVLAVLIICLTVSNPKWARDGLKGIGGWAISLVMTVLGKFQGQTAPTEKPADPVDSNVAPEVKDETKPQ